MPVLSTLSSPRHFLSVCTHRRSISHYSTRVSGSFSLIRRAGLDLPSPPLFPPGGMKPTWKRSQMPKYEDWLRGGSNTELPTQSPVLASWLSSMKISFQWGEVVFRRLCAQARTSQPTHGYISYVQRYDCRWIWIGLCMTCLPTDCSIIGTHTHACTLFWLI